MDAELKQKWLTALRSGKYKQGTAALKRKVQRSYFDPTTETQYCCLGVLACAGLGKRGSFDGESYYNIDGGGAYLSPQLLERVGLTDAEQHELARLNDDGMSFDDIADYIEQHI